MGLASSDGFDYVAESAASESGVGAQIGEHDVALGVSLSDDCAPSSGNGGGAVGAVPAVAEPGADFALVGAEVPASDGVRMVAAIRGREGTAGANWLAWLCLR